MRKIKIKEKNHNLRIKFKEGEWKSATSVAIAMIQIRNNSSMKWRLDLQQQRPVSMALRRFLKHLPKLQASSIRRWINHSIDLNAL